MKKLYGTVVPLITPYDNTGAVDLDSLAALSEYLVNSGLQCLYPCGTTGEMLLLNQEERKAIAKTVVDTVNCRIPVFIQVGAMAQRDTIELARHAVEIGADGIGVVTPSFFGLSAQGLIDFYIAVAKSVPHDFPIYLYSIPQNAVNNIDEIIAGEIAAKCKNVVGIKYSYPNMTLIQKLMLINQGTFSVLVGPDHLYEAVYLTGGDGCVSGNSQVLPEHYVALYNALKNGEVEKATRIQRRTNVLNNVFNEKKPFSAYKVVLREQGILKSAHVREPIEAMSRQEEETLLKKLEDLQYRTVLTEVKR